MNIHLTDLLHSSRPAAGHVVLRLLTAVCLVLLLIGSAALPAPVVHASPETLASILKLNHSLPAGGRVLDYLVSPNGQYVVYIAISEIYAYELFSVPLAGGVPTRLTPIAPEGTRIDRFSISADSSRVVYVSNQDTLSKYEVFSIPIAGPATAGVKISKEAVPGSSVNYLLISPDGSRVVYSADEDTFNVDELYSTPMTGPGSAAVKLNSSLPPEGDVKGQIVITPDSSRVIYMADQLVNDVLMLFSVPIAGGTPTRLNGANVVGGDADVDPEETYFPTVHLSPDGSRVVYRADEVTEFTYNLYSVPVAGPNGAAVLIGDPNRSTREFEISPDSSKVVYISESGDIRELDSAAITGGAPVRLNGTLAAGGYLGAKFISPDSSRVVYSAAQQDKDKAELYSVPIGGPYSAGVKISALPDGVNSSYLFYTPDSSQVIFLASTGDWRSDMLYSVPTTGPATSNVRLSVDGFFFDGNWTWNVSPDSSRVVYQVVTETTYDLYMVPAGGPASASVRLNGTSGAVTKFTICPDSSRVVYIDGSSGTEELYVADNGQTRIGLSPTHAFVTEGTSSVSLEVRLNQAAALPVSVQYATANGTATATHDYTTTSGTLNFAPGETGPKTITIPILNDAISENTESFTLTLSNPTNAIFNPKGASSTISIFDNDVTATTTTLLTSPKPSVVGQTVTATFTVSTANPLDIVTGGEVTVTGSSASCTAPLSEGHCELVFTEKANEVLVASYSGTATYGGSKSPNLSHRVAVAATVTTLTLPAPGPVEVGKPLVVNFSVAVLTPGSGTPTGQVMVTDGVSSCVAAVEAGTCTLFLSTSGSRTLTAAYAGSANFAHSTSGGTSQFVRWGVFLPFLKK
jgi:hypothetical protein